VVIVMEVGLTPILWRVDMKPFFINHSHLMAILETYMKDTKQIKQNEYVAGMWEDTKGGEIIYGFNIEVYKN